jgi:AcrR family transcriptional regulator
MVRELSPAVRERRRDRILETATEVFFEAGYAAATMSRIAARLGGSKATLYAYFRTKEELFEAIIRRQCDRLLAAFDEAGAQPGVKHQLTHLGMAFVNVLAAEPGVQTMQLAIEVSRRNRTLALRLEEIGVRVVTDKLVELLEAATRRGEISTPDPEEAANVFISLMRGNLHFRRLLNLIPEPTPEEMRAEVARAIEVFFRAFAPARPGKA